MTDLYPNGWPKPVVIGAGRANAQSRIEDAKGDKMILRNIQANAMCHATGSPDRISDVQKLLDKDKI